MIICLCDLRTLGLFFSQYVLNCNWSRDHLEVRKYKHLNFVGSIEVRLVVLMPAWDFFLLCFMLRNFPIIFLLNCKWSARNLLLRFWFETCWERVSIEFYSSLVSCWDCLFFPYWSTTFYFLKLYIFYFQKPKFQSIQQTSIRVKNNIVDERFFWMKQK